MIKRLTKSCLYTLSISAVALLLAAFSHQTASAQSGLTKIGDNVYAYVGATTMSPQNSFAANAGVIIGEDGIVVIDTLVSAKEAQRLIKDIRAISDKPIKYVVNTHYHFDHALGNSEFAKLGATIISHTLDKENLRASGEITLKEIGTYGLTPKDMEGTAIALPNLSFTDRLEIDLGNQQIELIYPGPSHSTGSILVYLPDKKILFTGDILFTNCHPFVAYGDIPEWLNALDYILAMDVAAIIPGHGPLSTKKDIAAMKEYLVLFDAKAKELCSKSNDINYIAAELKKALPHRDLGDSLLYGNIMLKYLKK